MCDRNVEKRLLGLDGCKGRFRRMTVGREKINRKQILYKNTIMKLNPCMVIKKLKRINNKNNNGKK